MARGVALAAAIAVSFLAVSGAGGAGAQTPKRGGTLNLVMALEPPCISLIVEPCQGRVLPVFGVVEGAFKQRPDYSWQPRLVSRVDVTTKPPFTLTYHIRPEARWSDGTPVTSRDFLFTHSTRLAFHDPGELHKTWIRTIRALGAKTVRVTLRSRFGYWQPLFSAVLPEHALRGEDLERVWSDRIDNPKTGRPIGNGPWLMQSWQRGEQLTLVRNPRYWGPHTAHIDRIVVRFSFDPTVAELFATDRADIGQWQFDPAMAATLRRVPGVRLRFAPTAPGFEHFDFRMGPGGHPALKNKFVRQALAYAIDRVAIVRAVVGTDVESSPRPRDSLVFSGGSRSYKPNWSGYRYRPDEARRLLERAGAATGSTRAQASAWRCVSSLEGRSLAEFRRSNSSRPKRDALGSRSCPSTRPRSRTTGFSRPATLTPPFLPGSAQARMRLGSRISMAAGVPRTTSGTASGS